MKALVTGGAGFIGRWVVRELLERGVEVTVLDDLSSGRRENIEEFRNHSKFLNFHQGDIKDVELSRKLLAGHEICFHLAASINVQDSIDDPKTTFENDICGTFHLLEAARQHRTRFVFVSTCMVYEKAASGAIHEKSPTFPASPYAAAKLAGEQLTLSYAQAYGLPFTVLRPFNTYGPFQKSNGEGGVVAVFTQRALQGDRLRIYGDGTQTRDLLYVEDCARFIVEAGFSQKTAGEVINASTGKDIAIKDLALKIAGKREYIEHVAHIHPQSEIARLVGDFGKAKKLLGWEPRISLEEGIARTRHWMSEHQAPVETNS